MEKRYIVLSVATASLLMVGGCCSNQNTDDNGNGAINVDSNYTIEQKGGTGIFENGGNANTSNTVSIDSRGANIRIVKSGTIDTSFTVPANDHVANLGNNGAVFSVNTHIPRVDSEPAAGVYYSVYDNTRIYQSDGDGMMGDEAPVTGIQVDEGVTLTLGLNDNTDHAYGDDRASFVFDNDVIINGTLKTDDLTQGGTGTDLRYGQAATTRDKGALQIVSNSGAFIVGENGAVDTSGDDGEMGQRGGMGGAIRIELMSAQPIRIEGRIDASGGDGDGANNGGDGAVISSGSREIGLYSRYGGSFVHTGDNTIDSSGGDGYGGGYGADIRIYTDGDIYNTGHINASGGDNEVITNGDGGYIQLSTDNGSLYNSGDIFSKGGDSSDIANGGRGGSIYLYPNNNEDPHAINLYNSGELNVNGGDSTMSDGGYGGQIWLETDLYGGIFKNSGNLYANGGSGDDWGGTAGYIQIYVNNNGMQDGTMEVSGNIHANGGDGTNYGGSTSSTSVRIDYLEATENHTMTLMGYNQINVSGGDGRIGGAGGYLDISASMGQASSAPSIYNEVDIYGEGGTGVLPLMVTNSWGGLGGGFDLSIASGGAVENSGNLYFNGGDAAGVGSNGDGGNIVIDDADDAGSITSTSTLFTVAAGTGGVGGSHGTIRISGNDVTSPDGTYE